MQKSQPVFQFSGSDKLKEILKPMLQQELICKTDWRLAALLESLDAASTAEYQAQSPSSGLEVFVSAALCSAALQQGSSCLQIDSVSSLKSSGLVCVNPAEAIIPDRPLVLMGDRLFLQRYFIQEREVAKRLRQRAQQNSSSSFVEGLSDSLNAQQKQAVRLAIEKQLCVITGGPGTGKTTIVASIISALKKVYPDVRLGLAAPTGKAAARLQQSLDSQHLDTEDNSSNSNSNSNSNKAQKADIKVETLHRLLGSRQSVAANYRYHQQNRLPLDYLIIDESSMVDTDLLFAVLSALPETATLILLGDAQQLPSVGVGRIFADVCELARQKKFFSDCFVELQTSYRFANFPAIGKLAESIIKGDLNQVLQFENSEQEANLIVIDNEKQTLEELLLPYQQLIEQARGSGELRDYFQVLDAYQILASTKHSALGVNAINQKAQQQFSQNRSFADGALFEGMPVMVTENHHGLGLYNGDTGVVVKVSANMAVNNINIKDGSLLFAFPAANGEAKFYLPAQLPTWQPCFAMTVHKAQGSEYQQVAIVLAEQFSKKQESLLSRELLYTAVTRAKQCVHVYYQIKSLEAAVSNSQQRLSGFANTFENT